MLFDFGSLKVKDWIIISIFSFLFLLIDALFINFVVKKNWDQTVLDVQNNSPVGMRAIFAIPAYICLILGLILFVYIPNKNKKPHELAIIGLIWGIISYGIFDFTNLVLFKGYYGILPFIDIAWGGFASGISILIACYIGSFINL